jgi:shikimate dehydrogenase
VAGGIIGLIGDHPSSYSRSPVIWQPALRHLGLDASYLPLDVPPDRLGDVLAVMRGTTSFWGANVTIPYKKAVIPLLDEVEPAAQAAGAVNTIVRHRDARLVGANTDGVGLVAALLRGGDAGPLVETLYGRAVLLIGAGGAARAAAVALGALQGTGELIVVNRSADRAADVVARVSAGGGRARVVRDDDLDACLPAVDLVVNASARGQGGIRKGREGWTCLEPYSALAPAAPAVLPPAASETAFMTSWTSRCEADIRANLARSGARMALLSRDAAVLDMVYSPPETTVVRQAREAGLRVANGRWMMIVQAAEACVQHICASAIRGRGPEREEVRREVIQIMAAAWPADPEGHHPGRATS